MERWKLSSVSVGSRNERNTKCLKLFWKLLLYENSKPKKCAPRGVQPCPLKTISAGLGDPHTEGLEGHRTLTYVPLALCHLLYITLLQLQVVLGKAQVNRPGKTRGRAHSCDYGESLRLCWLDFPVWLLGRRPRSNNPLTPANKLIGSPG